MCDLSKIQLIQYNFDLMYIKNLNQIKVNNVFS